MALLTGEYFHQLDAKYRIRIPAKLRKELGTEFFFSRGTDGCVFILPKEEVESILALVREIKLGDPRIRNAREFLKNILPVKEDDQGRWLLSADMREHIGLEKDDKEVIICGAGTRVEIWSRKSYDAYYLDGTSNFDELVKNLGY